MNLVFPVFKGDALCIEVGGDMFFPGENAAEAQSMYRAAKQVCVRCEIREECAEWAIVNDEKHGMWGGFTPQERHQIRKRRGLDRAVA